MVKGEGSANERLERLPRGTLGALTRVRSVKSVGRSQRSLRSAKEEWIISSSVLRSQFTLLPQSQV